MRHATCTASAVSITTGKLALCLGFHLRHPALPCAMSTI
jgi:hypothetical protein